MRHYIFIATLLLLTSFLFGQTVQRLADETSQQFVIRYKPLNTILTHKVLETKWNGKSIILAFYKGTYKLAKEKDPDQQEYGNIIATLYLQNDSNHYYQYLIDTISSDGGDLDIESVFFVNADTDDKKELAVIIRWHQIHYDSGGDWYGTFFYKYPDPKSNSNHLDFLEAFSANFYGCECDFKDKPSTKAKFKTAADVKVELLRLGFKQ